MMEKMELPPALMSISKQPEPSFVHAVCKTVRPQESRLLINFLCSSSLRRSVKNSTLSHNTTYIFFFKTNSEVNNKIIRFNLTHLM